MLCKMCLKMFNTWSLQVMFNTWSLQVMFNTWSLQVMLTLGHNKWVIDTRASLSNNHQESTLLLEMYLIVIACLNILSMLIWTLIQCLLQKIKHEIVYWNFLSYSFLIYFHSVLQSWVFEAWLIFICFYNKIIFIITVVKC